VSVGDPQFAKEPDQQMPPIHETAGEDQATHVPTPAPEQPPGLAAMAGPDKSGVPSKVPARRSNGWGNIVFGLVVMIAAVLGITTQTPNWIFWIGLAYGGYDLVKGLQQHNAASNSAPR
jgi:hypothetical protein